VRSTYITTVVIENGQAILAVVVRPTRVFVTRSQRLQEENRLDDFLNIKSKEVGDALDERL
jgi:hypothetical protein